MPYNSQTAPCAETFLVYLSLERVRPRGSAHGRLTAPGVIVRLLACDFDGTLFRGRNVSPEDVAALGRWKDAGNLFGIVTGRGARTLLADLGRFALPCDFLLCNNGALLLDGHGKYLAERPLDTGLVQSLLAHDIERGCASCALFAGLDMYVLEGGRPWINPVYAPGFMEREKALETRFLQMSFGFDGRRESLAWGERLAGELGTSASVQCSLSVVDVTAAGVGKASGISWALESLGFAPDDILAAGDDGNDKDMLGRFQGYAVGQAGWDVIEAAGGRHVPGVAAIVDEAL